MLTSQETLILETITVASHNNPNKPEFPYTDPKFPATPTYQITVPGFSNVRLKDESHNPTGTHKDRMAWEIVVTYKDFLMAKKLWLREGPLPKMSIITSGSAGYAIQTALKQFGLPNLKVLIDISLDTSIEKHLRDAGCEVYQTDLSKKILSPREILKSTNNEDGIDITCGWALDSSRFYDWLAYEVINSSPQRCFVPFGTGNLYENMVAINQKELAYHSGGNDPRFKGESEILRRCNFLGATTNNPKSKATKLYSYHLPFVHFDEQRLKFYTYAGFCGQHSNVYPIEEAKLDEAVELLTQQGVAVEPSGAAGLALLLQMQDDVPKDDKILIVSTGKTKR